MADFIILIIILELTLSYRQIILSKSRSISANEKKNARIVLNPSANFIVFLGTISKYNRFLSIFIYVVETESGILRFLVK